ncbi:MAG: DUF3768 domain-containing protein [Afipia sp.]|nr:DUF3768 domain-containing protein [Afipia sp.]
MSSERDCITATNEIAIMSTGVAALGIEAVQRLIKTISLFDNFCEVFEPYPKGTFDRFEFDGTMIEFRIDYENLILSLPSSDSRVKKRMITVILANEANPTSLACPSS